MCHVAGQPPEESRSPLSPPLAFPTSSCSVPDVCVVDRAKLLYLAPEVPPLSGTSTTRTRPRVKNPVPEPAHTRPPSHPGTSTQHVAVPDEARFLITACSSLQYQYFAVAASPDHPSLQSTAAPPSFTWLFASPSHSFVPGLACKQKTLYPLHNSPCVFVLGIKQSALLLCPKLYCNASLGLEFARWKHLLAAFLLLLPRGN